PVPHQQQEDRLLAQWFKLARVAAAPVSNNATANAIANFNALEDITADQTVPMTAALPGGQNYDLTETLRFWLGFSTACGPFNQFAICKDSTKLWDTSIYAREQAIISANSLSYLCTNNSVSVSPLESIIQGKRHCGVFIDVPLSAINTAAATTTYYYRIPNDIVFSGVLDLNQLNPIFNSFPVLTRNYASLYLQLWMQDFLQDLKVVWLNKTDTLTNTHLAYQMIPPEKPDIIYLLNRILDVVSTDGTPVHTNVYTYVRGINETRFIKPDQKQNNFIEFCGTRAYPDPVEVGLTPITHYLCDAIVRIMFDDNPDPQVLSLEVIGEMGGSMVRNG
ncbi:MAG: hypothetical protein EZS28_039598, partial [Streblomastix strix]